MTFVIQWVQSLMKLSKKESNIKDVQNVLSVAAVLYISGTQSYSFVKDAEVANPQFSGHNLLRPNPVLSGVPQQPHEIEKLAMMVLNQNRRGRCGNFT